MDPESSPPRVVVSVDASLAAQQAARFAAAEARLRRAPLHIVTVMPWPYRGPAAPPPPGIDLATAPGDGGASLVRATSDALPDEERLLAEALAGWREVGHRKRRPSLGSTTHGVLHRAACPVAIVPITGAGR